MGGKAGFARQLKKMGKEFRVQRENDRRQKAKMARNNLSTGAAETAAGTAGKSRQPQLKLNEGIYRDLSGKKVVITSSKNKNVTDEGETKKNKNRRDDFYDDKADEEEFLALQEEKNKMMMQQSQHEAESLVRENIIIEERKKLVQKVMMAAREGAKRVKVVNK